MILGRRHFLKQTLAAPLLVGTAATWQQAFAQAAVLGPSPYGAIRDPDANGVRLPAGFQARLIGVTAQRVAGTSYSWHGQPDGGATFAMNDRGWVYVSNSELDDPHGGVGAVRFDRHGRIVDAYRILDGTKVNCAGGPTPWGTWLSCEEHRDGLVWECDPRHAGQGIARPALGKFIHEAAAVDPRTGYVYLTEDDRDGRLYRFRPAHPQQLTSGVLEAASLTADGQASWIAASPEGPCRGRDTAAFARGEGAWFADGVIYFCTTADHRVWALDTATNRLWIIYDAALIGSEAPLRRPDNVTVHATSGDIYVAEDADDLQLVLLADRRGQRIAAPFLELDGHRGSEIAGPAFSPDGRRLYFSSQRGIDGAGMTFEVSGPFR
jgi:secreted PhoX family phosphatase